MKQGSNICLNFIKLANKDQFLQVSFFIPRNPNFFYGYCFSCGNFGHRAISSRFIRYNKSIGNRFKKPQKAMVQNSSNNSFSPLLNDHEFHI